MKTSSINYIQVFTMNFPCDLDLKLKPELGFSRRDQKIKWPSLEELGRDSESHYIEIRLRHSRYTLQTISLVLENIKGEFPQLEKGITECYANDSDYYAFDAVAVSTALEKLRLTDGRVDSNVIREQYRKWLNEAIEKCSE